MQTREDVLALLAEREPVAQLGPGEHRAGRIDARRPVRLHRERAQFVQAHIHLVGDIAEITPAAGGAAVVHLEVRDDAVLVDLDALGVLAADMSSTVRVFGYIMWAPR